MPVCTRRFSRSHDAYFNMLAAMSLAYYYRVLRTEYDVNVNFTVIVIALYPYVQVIGYDKYVMLC